jgi:hypothetical protein
MCETILLLYSINIILMHGYPMVSSLVSITPWIYIFFPALKNIEGEGFPRNC